MKQNATKCFQVNNAKYILNRLKGDTQHSLGHFDYDLRNYRLLSSSNFNTSINASSEHAKVVICGGGVMGASVAYHLGKLGWGSETILIEQNRVGGGTTWHASGLVGVFKPTMTQVQLTKSSVALYKELEGRGLPTGWKQCGSLNVARTRDRFVVFRRMKAQSVAWKIECELLTPDQCKQKCPLLKVDDLYGGLWIPGDGVGDAYQTCLTLVNEAKNMGVKVIENSTVKKVVQTQGKVSSVETNLGSINCEYFVNCGGFWARGIGQMSEPNIKVPLHAVEHYYLHTKPIPGLDPHTPVVRDQDGHIYFRENNGRLLAGGFEPVAKPAFEDGKIPANSKERELPEDWDHFHVLLEQLLHRIPSLGTAVLDRLCNGPEAFSPDCKWIVGEAPEIRNYLIAAGMKTIGISAAGGVGKATAELIVNGETDYDMYELEVSRFLGLHNNRKFLRDRVKEVPGLHYGINYPFFEFQSGRNLRMSPVYPKLLEAGAVFGQVMGYERPSWFDPIEKDEELDFMPYRIAHTNTFGKPPWFDFVAKEYAACREGVGISDYSSFTKVDLWSKGTEVVDSLQYICSNDVDVPVGSIIHTGMQNHRGGYENDCSLARLAENHYMMIAPTIQQTRCKVWLQKHLPPTVAMSDVTSMFTALCIMGPFTRTLLSELTDTDLKPRNFPFFTFKMLDIGLANGIRTMNLTHTGELGYVLYIPNEFALHVYSNIISAGEKYGIKHAGYYATRALRVEKFYAFWGQDLDTTTTPLECGRVWRVKFDKEINFIGRDALLKQREEGVKRTYIQLILDDHDCETDLWPWGGEPIYRNGEQVGMCTTTGYGFTFKKQVCLGFVENIDKNGERQKVTHDFITSGDFEVDIAGIKYHAKANLHSPILPTKYPDVERDVYRATRGKTDEKGNSNEVVKAI
ncbi:pyruvate dehydrogenase phosphatase regulatory subunit, mitochondrial isoform X2 [Cylas formicarius]|uniref:pyruvate dehydrogenase phosphatase regulatory subunit, mitochondrial isoform X2 n=1 Tax=Cylas formicarius TaxID=197179 RepID=UPI0029589FEC|nr:pyruvate dehydrogenase phosphatase regulatory subunit, mitochondrial isoform X2 [Cylas formicarius]